MNNIRKIRVLHLGKFYAPHKGGMESHLQTLCEALRDRVDSVVLVANDQQHSAEHNLHGVRVIRTATLGTFASTPLCPAMLAKALGQHCDIVHAHMPNPFGTVAALMLARTHPLIVSYHTDTVRQRLLGKIFSPLLNVMMQRSRAIICSSPNYLESSPVLSMRRNLCRIIPFGIELKSSPDERESAAVPIRRQFGSQIVLAVGRLVYYKGFEFLVQAIKDVPAAQLLIIGDGPLRQKLQSLARSCGGADRTTFLGAVEDVEPYYQAASVFVLPSVARTEAFGIVQVEAMACGKPVINTALNSGVPFVSLDGITGITVPPSDAQALANALRLLLTNEDLRLRFGRAALRRAQTIFGVQQMADSTYDLYEQVSGRKPMRTTCL